MALPLSAGAFVVGAYYTYVASQQKDATDRQIEIANRALDFQSRPWVAPNSVKIVSPSDDRANVQASIELRNFGTVPAFHIVSWILQYHGEPDLASDRFRSMCKSWCDLADAVAHGGKLDMGKDVQGTAQSVQIPFNMGFSIFPQNSIIVTQDIGFIPPGKRPGIFGCIAYTDQLEQIHHHTGFCFRGASEAIVSNEVLGICPVYQTAD